MDDVQLLGEEGQDFYPNYLVEMSNLLEVELPVHKKSSVCDDSNQRALDFLLLAVSEASNISSEQRLELLRSLLDNGANVNIQRLSSDGSILEKFLFFSDIEVIELLLSYGANVSVSMLTNYSSLPFYAKIRLLMNHGIDLNITDSNGNILHRLLDVTQPENLYYGVTRNYIEFLLANGVNPNVSNSNGFYPLDLAISAGHKEAEQILKEYNAVQSGQLLPVDPSLLLYAESYGSLRKGYYSLQDIMLCIGPSKYGGYCGKDNYRIAELLLEAGAIITEDMPVVAQASSLKNPNLVELYLNHGANPNAVNEAGKNGLMIAVLNRDMPIIHLLLNDGRIDINRTSIRLAEDEDEQDTHLNALDRALISQFWDGSIKEDFEVARLLIKHGAVISQASFDWHGPDKLKELKKYQDVIKNRRDLIAKKQPRVLLPTSELNPDRDIPRIIKTGNGQQEKDAMVPIYDVSTTINTNTQSTLGYVFSELFGIHSTQANVPVVIAIGTETIYGTRLLLGAIAANKAISDYAEYQVSTSYSRKSIYNTPERSYIPAQTAHLMLGNINIGFFTNPIDQMRFDGIIPEIDFYLDIPTIIDFSSHYKPRSILFTPDDHSSLAELSRLPGFSPSMLDTLQESFPDDRDQILQWGQIPGLMPEIRDFGTYKESFPDQSQYLDDFDMSVLLKDYGHFPTKVEWTSPSGTKQTYKVYQRDDIDWDLVRTKGIIEFRGKTNREAALKGISPELADGSKVNLHHIGQNSRGSLVEIGELTHKKGHKTLHQQHGINKGHPDFPVDHGSKWTTDIKNYWKDRAKNAR